MSFKVKGKIVEIGDIQVFDSGSKKISFVLETEEQYNNLYSFDLFKSGEYISHVEKFNEYNKVGDTVEVEFNIQCRDYSGKYYTNLQCWRIEKDSMGTTDEPNTGHETFVDDSEPLPF